MADSTLDLSPTSLKHGAFGDPVPGVVLVFSGTGPEMSAYGLAKGPLELGRGETVALRLDDGAVSRVHARVQREGQRWVITDANSRNGTYVDGQRVTEVVRGEELRVIRLGSSVLALVPDVRPYWMGSVRQTDERVTGPRLAMAMEQIASAARNGENLHVTGESGTGKELAARAFHSAGPRAKGPFVAVNCATIPEGVAERLLFGAKKGAYSGATSDSEGWVQAASGGTLFLDEVGELHAMVQAKLLRVLETKEVLPLGSSKPERVDIRVCSATLRDLSELVAAGRFREDLYYRIARPSVVLPPLRERPEEVPVLVQRELQRMDPGLVASASLIEECLLRSWPGNIRELQSAVREAARAALAHQVKVVERKWLPENAGKNLQTKPKPAARNEDQRREPSREDIEDTLRRAAGNVSRAARALGLHRTQLRRMIERHGIDTKSFVFDPDDADD